MRTESLPTFNPASTFASLEAYCRMIHADLDEIEVRVKMGGRTVNRFELPLSDRESNTVGGEVEATAVDRMAERIVDVLRKLRLGDSLNGSDIAARIEPGMTKEHGTFKSAMRLLKANGPDDPNAVIVPLGKLGYRLKLHPEDRG